MQRIERWLYTVTRLSLVYIADPTIFPTLDLYLFWLVTVTKLFILFTAMFKLEPSSKISRTSYGFMFGKPYTLFFSHDEHFAMVRVSKKRLDTAVQKCR